MSLDQGTQGQAMPAYEAIAAAKYGNKVLLERIVRLLLCIRHSADWAGSYISATSSLHGELPLCKEAVARLTALRKHCAQSPAPLQRAAQVTHHDCALSLVS